VLLAAGVAASLTLAAPRSGPTSEVFDLVSDGGGAAAAIGREPAPTTEPISDLRPADAARLVPPDRPLAEPRNPTAPPLDVLTGYVWPIKHPRLTLPFGPTPWGSRIVGGERFHDGVDLATFCGDPIGAAHAGIVLAASRRYDAVMGWRGDLGPYLRRLDRKHLWSTLPIVVVIDDGNGYRSVYAHFERVVVRKGQHVRAGQLIGYEGATGRASGCHLHYGLFSPWERKSFSIARDVVKRMKVPTREVARVDPLLVLPPKAGINAPPKSKSRATAGPGTPATTAPPLPGEANDGRRPL
jgi:murein DD-endopeptidase MepM/ murein hydrolase activator NlpD